MSLYIITPNFNIEKESYIISLDANSLYVFVMCYELQFGELKFVNDVSNYIIMNTSQN